ncbi:unnamed protein product, partial [Prorocentrum cordatum]
AAASDALVSLRHLSNTRAAWFGKDDVKAGPIVKGVAKLGWSWEAMDVTAWASKSELQAALSSLSEQPGSLIEHVFVQEWVDFDVEMRHFIVEPRLEDPQTWKAKKIVYTVFKTQDEGSFRNFDRYERKGCLGACFKNDDAALADAEQQAEELIGRWLQWLQGMSHELPVVTRFDILAKRVGPGKARVAVADHRGADGARGLLPGLAAGAQDGLRRDAAVLLQRIQATLLMVAPHQRALAPSAGRRHPWRGRAKRLWLSAALGDQVVRHVQAWMGEQGRTRGRRRRRSRSALQGRDRVGRSRRALRRIPRHPPPSQRWATQGYGCIPALCPITQRPASGSFAQGAACGGRADRRMRTGPAEPAALARPLRSTGPRAGAK